MIKKLVIVGGGFSGLYAIKKLNTLITSGDVETTLINRRDSYVDVNKLMEVAGGRTEADTVKKPIKDIISGLPINFVHDSVLKVNVIDKKVFTNNGEYTYDYLILSTGFKPNFYDLEGVGDYTMQFDNLDSAVNIRNRVLENFEKANNGEDVSLNFSIIGGGLLGVGLAVEIRDLIYDVLLKKFTNINVEKVAVELYSNGEILDYFSEAARKKAEEFLRGKQIKLHLKAKILKIDANGIRTDNGYVETKNIIWVDGLKAEYPEIEGSVSTDVEGKLVVNELLQLEKYASVFVIGGSSTGYPVLDYTATQAENIAVNLTKLVGYAKNEHFDNRDADLKLYNFEDGAKFINLGKSSALLDLSGSVLMGGPARFTWKTFIGSKFIL